MAKGDPPLSPLAYDSTDYAGKSIHARFHFIPLTGVITSAVVWRDAECVYHRIAIGVGPDGSPDSSPTILNVPPGTEQNPGATYLAPQLTLMGILNLTFLMNNQITALQG